jgi:methyl-accepting chemotaxis protein
MTLKARINIAAVTSILLVAVTLLVFGKLIENSVEARFQEASITGKTALWQKIITSQLDHMGSNTSSIARDRETLKALKVGDTALLAENVVTTYNMLSAGGILTKLQIANLKGRILFSAPDNFEGNTRKTLATLALKEGKVMRGIERDDDGKLYVNLAFPVYVRGKPVGVALYMNDLQSAIEDFKLNDKSDTFILNAKGSREYATDKNLLEQLDLALPALGSQSMAVAKLGDKAYSIVVQPVSGVDGQALAHLVSAKDQTKSYHAQQTFAFISYVSIIVVLLISVGGLTWYLRKNFKPLSTAVEIMNRISQGDLTDQVETVNPKDEIGQLMQAMGSMTNNLRRIVSEVYKATDTIDCSSQELFTNNMDMSHRTEEQASSLEETAASMEEMASTVKQNANLAQQANQLANTARDDAEQASQVVERTVKAMNEINESSTRIADIISTIDAIAFQTNLLALNAAVEAARAGEQGRGFAVVASEVRTLAQRSAEAAKEIKGLIGDSVEKVNVGTNLVDESSQTLMDITESIKKVDDIITGINIASQEQSVGIDQVSKTVTQMDDMTQQDAALVEETAAASSSMQAQATGLTKLMEFFKLNLVVVDPEKNKELPYD